ncbi:MAG: hydrogenase iron-sulfur subunit, partial [Candidatus Heimdallarchaeota archaeon]|nr:hydrogenase iron-sulfur subunit [Candidatus Heimdallarchaeota archaeon]
RRRISVMKKLLEFMGINPERVKMTWVSAAEGRKFADVVDEVTAEIKKLGPNTKIRRKNEW